MIRVPQRFEFIRFVAVRAIVDMALAAIIGVILVMVWHWSLPAAAGVWGLAVAAALLLQAASRRLHV